MSEIILKVVRHTTIRSSRKVYETDKRFIARFPLTWPPFLLLFSLAPSLVFFKFLSMSFIFFVLSGKNIKYGKEMMAFYSKFFAMGRYSVVLFNYVTLSLDLVDVSISLVPDCTSRSALILFPF